MTAQFYAALQNSIFVSLEIISMLCNLQHYLPIIQYSEWDINEMVMKYGGHRNVEFIAIPLPHFRKLFHNV